MDGAMFDRQTFEPVEPDVAVVFCWLGCNSSTEQIVAFRTLLSNSRGPSQGIDLP
jgi:hypothetical protein